MVVLVNCSLNWSTCPYCLQCNREFNFAIELTLFFFPPEWDFKIWKTEHHMEEKYKTVLIYLRIILPLLSICQSYDIYDDIKISFFILDGHNDIIYYALSLWLIVSVTGNLMGTDQTSDLCSSAEAGYVSTEKIYELMLLIVVVFRG